MAAGALGTVGLSAPSSTLNPISSLPSSSPPLWKNLFSQPTQSSNSFPSPTILEDGTPMVTAPPDILLKASEAWKDHLFCSFFGTPPSPSKIFSDLNPIWGKRGAISVKNFSEGCCLIFVPVASVRRWILDVGFWSAGTVSFAVSEWSASSTFQPQQLTSAPAWLSLRHVPPQLWSEDGLQLIASGVGKALTSSPGRKTFSLPSATLGIAKIRAVVRLVNPMPSVVEVQDKEGNAVRVGVEYDRLPPLCPTCSCYGHGSHRCPYRGSASLPNTSLPKVSVQGGLFLQNLVKQSCPSSPGPVEGIKPIILDSAQPIISDPHVSDHAFNSPANFHSQPKSPLKSPAHQQSGPTLPPYSSPSRSESTSRRRRSSSSPRLEQLPSKHAIDHDISTSPRYRSVSPPRTISLTKPSSPIASLPCSQPHVNEGSPPAPSSTPADSSPHTIPPPLLSVNRHIRFSSPSSSESCKAVDSIILTSSTTTSPPSTISLRPNYQQHKSRPPPLPISTDSHDKTPLDIRTKVKELSLQQLEDEEEEALIAHSQKLKRQVLAEVYGKSKLEKKK